MPPQTQTPYIPPTIYDYFDRRLYRNNAQQPPANADTYIDPVTGIVYSTGTTTNIGVTESSSVPSATSPLTTKGDIATYDTAPSRLGVGTNGQVVVADSTTTTGLKWSSGAAFPTRVIVYNSTASSVLTTTYADVVFNTEIVDNNNDFSSNTFTAPSTGVYCISCKLIFSGVLAGSGNTLVLSAKILESASTITEEIIYGYPNQGPLTTISIPIMFTRLVPMNATDTLKIQAKVGPDVSPNNWTLSGTQTYINLSIFQVA